MITLSQDTQHTDYTIRAYQPNGILINDTLYHQSVLLTSHHLETDNLPDSMTEIDTLHIDRLLALQPAVVLIGSGQHSHLLSPALQQRFLVNNIGLEVMTTQAACRTMRLLIAEQRNVAALLII